MTHEEQFPNCPFCYANKKEAPVIDDSNCHCGPCTAMNEPLTLEGDIRYLKAHIETKDRQLDEKDEAIADAEFRIRIYRDAVADAENESIRLRGERDGARAEVAFLKRNYSLEAASKLRAELATANAKVELLTTERDLARNKLEAWRDAEGAAIRLDKKNSQLFTRITELEDTIMRLGEEKRIGGFGHNLGLQQENERLNKELEASRGQVLNQLQIIRDLRKEKETLVNDRTSLVEETNELYEAIGRIGGIVNEIND